MNDEFEVSIGFIGGKRCLAGMLELLVHCHYLVAVDDARLGWPEVTLPVVPGMEGCHWPFRRTSPEHWPKLVAMQLGGAPVKAGEAVGWLIDCAGKMDDVLKIAWMLATDGDHGLRKRPLESGRLDGVPSDAAGLAAPDGPLDRTARGSIMDCIQHSCGVTLAEALPLQAKIAAEFLNSKACREGRVGAEYARTMRRLARSFRSRRSSFAVASAYGSSTSTVNVPGTIVGRGCGRSAVGSGGGPNDAVTTYTRPDLGSRAMVRAPRWVESVSATA